MDLFDKYIYGMTPLYTTMKSAFENFKVQSNDKNGKFLFIISDGELNDIQEGFDYVSDIRKEAEDNKIIR